MHIYTIKFKDLTPVPKAIVIEIVESEERGRIEIADVMLLCVSQYQLRSWGIIIELQRRKHTSHVPRCPICIWIYNQWFLMRPSMRRHHPHSSH